MDKKYIIAKSEKRRDTLRNWEVKRVGLFGSYLNETQKKGSNIDLLISLNDLTARNYFGLWTYFENLFKRKVDLIIESDLRKELNYVKGKVVYVKI